MIGHGLGKNARSLALTPPQSSLRKLSDIDYGYPYSFDMTQRDKMKRSRKQEEEEDPEKQALSFVPGVGKYAFWFHGYRMRVEKQAAVRQISDTKGRAQLMAGQAGNENIVITCPSLFAGARPIKSFLEYVKATSMKEHSTTIYRANNGAWDQGLTRPSRNLNAATLDCDIKEAIVKDIKTFLTPATRKYYANRGIPYRRGIHFYGKPECGKTSFANALAGHFDLNVYMLSLSSKTLDDDMLQRVSTSSCRHGALCYSRTSIVREFEREDMSAKLKGVSKKYNPQRHGQLYDVYGNPVVQQRKGVPHYPDYSTSSTASTPEKA